ncbi:MarR family winged helix-turn-helix transcriptional regulator [uncultured Amnibacterium sp.]|uniref:MarR family winged helix-turn-helix transcriptional regulator n=1 Tax=uncultured Amnibacterium sp. TaxID=1631851 RepID=UPI0035CB20CC
MIEAGGEMTESAMTESGSLTVGLPGEDDWALWRDFVAMRRELDRAVEQRLQQDAGLSTPEFEVLRSLSLAQGHRLRAGALADSLGWEKSRISHQVSRMTTRGLVERADCSIDARGTWVVLSARGADALARAACGYTEVLSRLFFDALEPADKRAIRTAASRVARSIGPTPPPTTAATTPPTSPSTTETSTATA